VVHSNVPISLAICHDDKLEDGHRRPLELESLEHEVRESKGSSLGASSKRRIGSG
jgi:hypothetical protein